MSIHRTLHVEENETIHVYMIVLPNTLMLDMIGPAEVFNYANRYGKQKFILHFVGLAPKIETSLGLSLTIDLLPSKIESRSWLFVPGLAGADIDFSSNEYNRIKQWLGNQGSQRFEKIISVCSGALLLGFCHLLNDRQCTTHFSDLERLQQLSPKAKVLQNRLFVQDNNIYTSAGVTAGIDLTLFLVEDVSGAQCAAKIARNMVLFNRRSIQDPAESPWLIHRNHLHQGIHSVQDKMQSDPAKDWRLAELAAIAHCSTRHLARLFKEHTQISCKRYLQLLRISLAKQLLAENSLSVEQVAFKVGFNDVRQFRRVWQQYSDLPPSKFQNKA